MNLFWWCFLGVFLTMSPSFATNDNQRYRLKQVKLEVFYDSLCPYSIRFIRNQLSPTINSFEKMIDLILVPSGNGKIITYENGTMMFKCAHGINECLGNKLHSCAIAKLNVSMDVLVSFIGCTLARRTPHKNGEKCAQRMGLEFREVANCFSSQEGDLLLAQMIGYSTEETTIHGKRYVPWIVVNGKHDEKTQRQSQKNLKRLLCKKFVPHYLRTRNYQFQRCR